MTEQRAPSKAELLEALRSSGRDVVQALSALPAEVFERGVYENGWNGHQILAHIASIEWTYPRLLDIARQPAAAAQGDTTGDATPRTRTAQGGIDAYNQRQVTQRVGVPTADLLAEFQKNRAATLAAIEGVEDALLATPIRSAGGVTGPLAHVIHQVAVGHVLGHVRDIASGS